MAKAWKLEIFRDKQKKCRIRLRSGNGRIIMSSEAYSSHGKALETVEAFLHTVVLECKDLTVEKSPLGKMKSKKEEVF